MVWLVAMGPASRESVPAEVRSLAEAIRPRLEASRYMARVPGTAVVVPGWEGFPTFRHSYVVTDKKDGTRKEADVILLNPSAERLAVWIVSGVEAVEGRYTPERGMEVFRHILGQSGGQFPVAGVVYEDILPADGVNETYAFRDGVTVRVKGLGHRITEPLTAEQRELSLTGPVEKVFTYARIASTSPKQWVAVHPEDARVMDSAGNPTAEWMAVIRGAYQRAWASEHNELLEAWLKANPTVASQPGTSPRGASSPGASSRASTREAAR